MCGRFTLRTPMSVLIKQFAIELTADQQRLPFEPRYDIPPTVDIPAIRLTDRARRIAFMRWGLLPAWTKDIKRPPLLNNARLKQSPKSLRFGLRLSPGVPHSVRWVLRMEARREGKTAVLLSSAG